MDKIGLILNWAGLLFLFCTASMSCYGQVTTNWAGTTSADWNTASNWSTGTVPGAADIVQIGLAPFTNQPVVGANAYAGNIVFGGTTLVTLTVNSGDSLKVSGYIQQNLSVGDFIPGTSISGSGTVTCQNIVVGNNSASKIVGSRTTVLTSKVASLIVSGNLSITSATTDLLSGGIAHNNSTFSLEGGILTLAGQIKLDNSIPVYIDPLPGRSKPLSKFVISITSSLNATLKLSDSSSVTMTHAGYDSVDFYHPASGSGKSTVVYTGGNQLVYTSNAAGLDTLSGTYQNLIISGTGTKTAGSDTTKNKLNIAGDLTITSGTMDLQSFAAGCTVHGNFANRSAINVGLPGITFKGPSFVNAGQFNYDNALVTFAGGTQTLADSTITGGTNLRQVAFADTGTKHIHHGIFAIIPQGRISLSNNVTVMVDTTGTLILRSDSLATAAITAIPSGSVIKGTVNAEWFVQGSWTTISARGYRPLSSAVNHTGNTDGTGDYNINWLKGTTNFNGAIVSGTAGSVNGFDNTPNNNPTLYFFREDVNSSAFLVAGNYRGLNKINNTDINDVGTQKRFTTTAALPDTTVRVHVGNSFLFFFRGNRVSPNGTTGGSKIVSPFNYPESVTFTNKGTVNQGQVQVKLYFRGNNILSYTDSSYINNSGFRGENHVGNPYPSAINLDNFSVSDSTAAIYGPGLKDTIYIFTKSAPVAPIFDTYVPDPSHDRNQIYHGTGAATNIIASGQGFAVIVDPTSAKRFTASLRFREAAKFNPPDTTGMGMMMRSVRESLALRKSAKTIAKVKNGTKDLERLIRIRLMQDKTNSDDIVIRFNKTANGRDVGIGNLPDPDRPAEAPVTLLSYASNHKALVTDNSWPLPVRPESILLYTNAMQTGQYTLNVYQIKNIPAVYQIRLRDKMTGKLIDLRENNTYTFSINKQDKTSYGDRFELVITKK